MLTVETPRLRETLDHLLSAIDVEVARALDGALDGREVGVEDAERLFAANGLELHALCLAADALRRRRVGDEITFVTCRNIQFTNICYVGCSFCAFAHHEDSEHAYRMPIERVVERAVEAWEAGCTEVCMQGGLHPAMVAADYRDLVAAIKARLPEMHVHAFSPFEIQYMAKRSKMSVENVLRMLKEAGLGSIPGTAAEILDTEVRKILTKNKLTAEAWIDIVKTAHRVGLFSTSTIMFGHVDGPGHWARHLALLRDVQKETGGFTEFVPLGFIHQNTRLYQSGKARPGPTGLEDLRMHAVARLMLDGWINNVQVSWVKMGAKFAQMCLNAGANDFGGTLMNESISRAAGSTHGQSMSVDEFVRLIREMGRVPVRRSTGYAVLERFS
ncbi:MAG: 7,8-didemethyl-8-hydroxy-5-deazariboflavin synthase subunit CofH [Armatimonadetes bacterium]|nr:7,8-didemethyl-8-hydroxy-5-deazariboflavin synthase subunit CofH [Armatimonadota bacterium]